VGTVPKSNIKIPHCGNSSKIKNKNTTLWEQIQNQIDFGTVPTVWYFYIRFWNCSHSVVFLYLILELFPQCGIFIFDFGTVPTVWYFYI
jgi:hypothetical protein